MKKLFAYACLASAALALVACGGLSAADMGSVEISLSTGGTTRSLTPDADIVVKSYDIFGSGPGSESFSETDITKESYTAGGLAPGEWTITAVGKNAAGVEIVQGSTQAVIVSGTKITASILCTPFVGKGTLSILLTWPKKSIGTPAVVASLTPVDGTERQLDIQPETSGDLTTATWSDTTLANGFYTLTLQLRDSASNTTVWGIAETVLVLKGATTKGEWTLDANAFGIGGIGIVVNSNVPSPIKVSFSGEHDAVLQGYPQKVTASATPPSPAPTWSWYLNGSPVANASFHMKDMILETSALSGSYNLSALARSGADQGSAYFTFVVYPNDSDLIPLSNLMAGYACNKASVVETSRNGIYVLSSGPGDIAFDKSELEGSKQTGFTAPSYCGGKAFLGIPRANGKDLTKDFKISFKRTIASTTRANPHECMYFNLIVDGEGVHNAKESDGARGVLVAATPLPGESVVLDQKSIINNVSGGYIVDKEGNKLEKNKFTLGDLAELELTFVNAVTKDNGTPINKKLAAVLIIVGDSRGKDHPDGDMSNVTMTVSNVSYEF